METTTLIGSNIPVKTHIIEAVKPSSVKQHVTEAVKPSAVKQHVIEAVKPSVKSLTSGPVASDPSWYATWQGNGNITLNINCDAINAASNVMISISEYWDVNNAVNTRFMGAASFAVNNICPRAGGVVINMDINWPNPLLIYISILIS